MDGWEKLIWLLAGAIAEWLLERINVALNRRGQKIPRMQYHVLSILNKYSETQRGNPISAALLKRSCKPRLGDLVPVYERVLHKSNLPPSDVMLLRFWHHVHTRFFSLRTIRTILLTLGLWYHQWLLRAVWKQARVQKRFSEVVDEAVLQLGQHGELQILRNHDDLMLRITDAGRLAALTKRRAFVPV